MKKALLIMGLLGAGTLNAASLAVNHEAVGKPSMHFLEQIDDLMPGYIRALSFQKPTEFNALAFAAMLNQTANIEKKLDVLIAEMRENNRLLKQKK